MPKFDSDEVQGAQGPQISTPKHKKFPSHVNLNNILNIFLDVKVRKIFKKIFKDFQLFEVKLSKFDSDGVQGAQGPQISPYAHKKFPAALKPEYLFQYLSKY